MRIHIHTLNLSHRTPTHTPTHTPTRAHTLAPSHNRQDDSNDNDEYIRSTSNQLSEPCEVAQYPQHKHTDPHSHTRTTTQQAG